VEEAYENGTCSLRGKKGLLKDKQNMCNLKMYVKREEEQHIASGRHTRWCCSYGGRFMWMTTSP